MKITVIRSAVIDAPIDRVWAVLRDFNSHGRWHPAVARSRMENDVGGDVVLFLLLPFFTLLRTIERR